MPLNAHIGIPFVQTTKQMFGTAFMVISGLVMGKCFLVLFSIINRIGYSREKKAELS